ncbi:MAG: immunoglobulin domain-containing protein [Eubacterium sp.]|uniref:immunoglobulin domain-containing protein n=1 Tax=uncultured Eubacterium sp. TaxID=165185 RepID=UPI0011C8A6B6|nr:immunoglobulin domain-containing protein [Eubacterium sp.]
MLRKQLFKQAAVCVLAAGMIMSNIPCTQVNGIYASVDVTNSVTVNLSQKIQVVSADSKSVLYKFVPTQTDTYALFSEGNQSVHCNILNSTGDVISNFYPMDSEGINFCTNYEMKEGQVYYFQIISESGSPLNTSVTLRKYSDVSLKVDYLGDSKSNHVKIPVILGKPVTVSLNAKVTSATGTITYSWYAYDKNMDLTYLPNEKGETLTINQVNEQSPIGYRCVVSNGINSEIFEIELLSNISVSEFEKNNEEIFLNDSKKVAFRENGTKQMVFKFVPNTDGQYAMYSSESEENNGPATRCDLYDETGKYIDYNEYGNEKNFVVIDTLEKGKTYYFVISSNEQNYNSFRVTLKKSDDVKLKINYSANYDVENNRYNIICKEGENISIGIGAIISSDIGTITYKWFNGNSLIEGENNATISINNANSDNAGLYYCQVSNGMDTKTFKILLTVNKVEDVTTKTETTTKQEETTTKAEVTTVVNNTQQTTTATTQTTTNKANTTTATTQTTTNKANTTTVNGTQQTTQTLDAGTQTIVGTGKIKSAVKKARAKKVVIKLKKVNGASGYEIKVSTSKKFAKKTTKTVDAKKLSVTVKKLQPNKKYFAKVRAYVIVNGTKVYGKYSKAVKIKLK